MLIKAQNFSFALLVLVSSVFFSGCATVTGNCSQNVAIQTYDKNHCAVPGVRCKLSNDKGTWYANAPDAVMVQKSAGDLHIVCEKPGHEPGIAKVVSKANAGMFGNIILGGGIGAIVDHTKGTAYNYPNTLNIVMGETKSFPEKKSSRKN